MNFCALARTRSQAKREEKEDAETQQLENPGSDNNDETESAESIGRKSLQTWLDKVKIVLETGPGDNLVDHHHDPISQLTLSKAIMIRCYLITSTLVKSFLCFAS